MKYLARLILSIESLIKNPISWFTNQTWILRVLIPILLVPAISAISIFSYQKAYLHSFENLGDDSELAASSELEELKSTLESYHDSEIEEIIYLREEIDNLKLAMNPDESNPLDPEVLGVDDSNVINDVIKQRLKDNSSDNGINPDVKSAYIRTDDPSIVMYELASTTSEKVTDFEVGTFYPVLSEQNNWVELDFGDGNSAWIDIKYIIIFPIDENN